MRSCRPAQKCEPCSDNHHKKCYWIPTFFLGVFLGGVYGMLFTKSSGEDLRKQLKKSKMPFKDLFRAGMEVDISFLEWIGRKIKEKF